MIMDGRGGAVVPGPRIGASKGIPKLGATTEVRVGKHSRCWAGNEAGSSSSLLTAHCSLFAHSVLPRNMAVAPLPPDPLHVFGAGP